MVDFTQYVPKKKAIFAHICPNCGEKYYPAPMVCHKCGTRRDPTGSKYAEWPVEEMKGQCTLLTWTRLTALPIGFNDRYLLFGIVEFPNGIRASGLLRVESPETGMTLFARADVVRTNRGTPEVGLVFEKSKSRISGATGAAGRKPEVAAQHS